MLFTFAVVQPAEAIAPLVVIGVFALGCFIGGVIGGYLAASQDRQAMINSVNWQYVNDTALSYKNLIDSSTQEFTNEQALMSNLNNYFARKAEYAAQFYINESSLPYAAVMELSGLADEYDNLTGTTKTQLTNLAYVAQGFANTTFTGDINDYTVDATSQVPVASMLYAGSNLKGSSVTLSTGLVSYWNTPSVNVPSSISWSYSANAQVGAGDIKGASGSNWTATTGGFYLPANTSLTAHFKARSGGGFYAVVQLLNGLDDTVLQAVNSAALSSSNVDQQCTLNAASTTQDTYVKVRIVGTDAAVEVGTLTLEAGGTGAVADLPYNNDLGYFYKAANGHAVQAFTFKNSTATQYTVSAEQLQNKASAYLNALKSSIRNAMSAAVAYHTYLRNLGYTDYSQLESPIPPLDVVMPATNSTFWDTAEISSEEYYAMFAAYMKSLNDLFDNATVARTIETIDTRNITMTNLPVYATGRIFDNSSNSWTAFCSSIWVQPTLGNITLTKGQNCTLGTTSQIIYKVNSTGTITYLVGAANDIIEVTDIQLKGTSGAWTTQDAVTLSTSTLETYATTYITGYEGIDYPDATIPWGTAALTSIIMLVAVVSIVGKIGTKRKH